jgi:hypothetical protein
MAGADYWICPICGRKALYDDVDRPDDAPEIEVVHTECLERDRAVREKAVRLAASDELAAWANEIPEGERLTGPRGTRHRTLMAAARKVLPPMTMAEVADAIRRGDYMVCNGPEVPQ